MPKTTKPKKKTAMPEMMITPQEAALTAKYPDTSITPGSWMPSGGSHGNKATVIVICPCGVETVRATSDVWQCKLCPLCKKDARKGRAAAKAAKK